MILIAAVIVEFARASLSPIAVSMNGILNRTDLRCDGLLIGSALACAWSLGGTTLPHRAMLAIGACWPVAALTLGYICVSETAAAPGMFRFGYSAASISSGVLIYAAVTRRFRVLNGALNWRPLRWTGAISYGLYVYHWVISPAFYYSGVSEWRTYVGIPLSFGLAAASYFFLQRPMLHFGRSFDKGTLRCLEPSASRRAHRTG